MVNNQEQIDRVSRRTVLKASAITAGTLGTSMPAAANSDDLDEPEGFEVNILASHAPFPDDLASQFRLKFAENSRGTIVSNLKDSSTTIFAEVNWNPGGTSGWHFHPGVVIVNIVKGELEVTWERDCVPRTYTAGESFFDPGEVHIADNSSGDDPAKAYAIFLGIPDGEPATIWVEPVEC